ncbi:hypothetical protein [Undibacterium sp.]|uniref:hypothetical protein n=1 Tax=Undibacterium sp. TaxID=1914977 RepID=UPI003750CCB4
MADYKETSLTGKSWQRCNQVMISNPRNGVPMVRLSEEVIANLGEKEFAESLPGIMFEFDPNIVIQMRNPETGEAIPGATMTGLQVYVAMFSLYIQKAQERDALIAS